MARPPQRHAAPKAPAKHPPKAPVKPKPKPKPTPVHDPKTSADTTSAHVYFGVPLGTDTAKNAFSGQYLRLEEYVGTSEDPHLPTSLSKSGLKGIAISATGYFLVNAKLGVYETYGKALTEAISGADHAVTIEKGDWTLIAENGAISISTTNTGSVGKMVFESTGSDIVFTAINGKASTSDSIDIKESTTNTVTFTLGFEFSFVAGFQIKTYVGFLMNINVAGDLSVKLLDIKAEAFPIKINIGSGSSFGLYAFKGQLIGFKFGIVDSKTMVIYNKINTWQIYNELGKVESKLIKEDITLTSMDQKVAAAEKVAASCSFWQLMKM